MSIFKKINGMDIVGQGGKIILFMLPSLAGAILLHLYLPEVVALPKSFLLIRPLGYVLLVPGLVLWASAVIQLLIGFPQGKLVSSGAYSIVRNPIYSSASLFILPAVALLTQTWVYLVPSIFLIAGVLIFIGKEERQLTDVFGDVYRNYTARVDRLIPFKKP
jgi:protein-S-isoprenylcysteine O-methyltransferase Ste14